MLYPWILTCLLSWVPLHATDALNFLEASHNDQLGLRIEKLVAVPIEKPFAFVYNNNAKTKEFRNRNLYLIDNPIMFNSQGPSKKFIYDSKTGELIVPEAGYYEIAYSFFPVRHGGMNLVVNGKDVRSTIARADYSSRLNTALFVLKLAKGDRVGLSVFDTTAANRNHGVGTSISLSMTKL
jgi:hypothetical protein